MSQSKKSLKKLEARQRAYEEYIAKHHEKVHAVSKPGSRNLKHR